MPNGLQVSSQSITEKVHLVLKSDGSQEPFIREKLIQSLRKSGARPDQAEEVAEEIESSLRGGETTSTIYRRAFELLKQTHRGVAARYSMRRALAELGPSGFPFEAFVSALFASEGYKTSHGVYLLGECVQHEVDLIAEGSDRIMIGELKFHNRLEIKSDLKVALYVQARFEDIKKGGFKGFDVQGRTVENWLITNTKFTTQAEAYAQCVGLNLIGWSWPRERNLAQMIETSGLEPLTMLTTLSHQEKQSLMQEGHILCRLVTQDVLESSPSIPSKKIAHILEEVQMVCNPIE